MFSAGSPEDTTPITDLPKTILSSGEPVDQTTDFNDIFDYISLLHSILTIGVSGDKTFSCANNNLTQLLTIGRSHTESFLNANNINPNASYQKWYPLIMDEFNITSPKSNTKPKIKCLLCDNYVSKNGYQMCNQHIPKCTASLRSTGITCTNNASPGSPFCGKHLPKTQHTLPLNLQRCTATLQHGSNKGLQCTHSAIGGSSFCGIHKNYTPITASPKNIKTLNRDEFALIHYANWTSAEFFRIKSLRLYKPVYTQESTMDLAATALHTNHAIQQRYNKVTNSTLSNIKSATTIAGEFIRMEKCDKDLSDITSETNGYYYEFFDNRLKMIEECKYYKKFLNKAFVRHKAKLSGLPTINIIVPTLPNVDDILFQLNRGIRARSDMNNYHREKSPTKRSTRPPVTPPTTSPVTSPPVRRPASPILFTPTPAILASISPTTSPATSPITSPPKVLQRITLPFPIDGSEITDPKYSPNDQGLLNRYNDLAVYCEALVNSNIEGETLNFAKSYMRSTYAKLKSRKIPTQKIYTQFHY